MTDAEIAELARLMGATIVCKVPVYSGVTGAAHLARFYQLRMAALQAEEAKLPDPPLIVQVESRGDRNEA